MDDLCSNMQPLIRDSLDNLVSARSSINRRTQALDDLEQLLARVLASTVDASALELFNFLQDTFECNIPSRLIDWISTASLRLDHLLSRGASDCDKGTEAAALSAQLAQALSLVQGVALIHNRSKVFLGRKHSLEVLVDLLWASRHSGPSDAAEPATTAPSASATSPDSASTPTPSSKPKSAPKGLAQAVLDTLLCVLVDSSPALRVFEGVSGVHIVVKLLKRPNALRDVKMKCLEFLYFYLLDEAGQINALAHTPTHAAASALPPTPLSPSPFITSHSHARRDASTSSDDSYSSRSTSSSTSSLASASSFTSTSSTEISPRTPPRSPTDTNANTPRGARRPFAKPRSLLLLQKEVDFVPLSPKKAHVARLGVGTPNKGTPLRPASSTTPSTPRRTSASTDAGTPRGPSSSSSPSDIGTPRGPSFNRTHGGAGEAGAGTGTGTRTMEQKKAFLGTMLGNVDALVAGVRNAGVALG